MTFILISGKPGTGKTAVCNRLHGMLDQNGNFILRYRQSSKVACPEDNITHYEKDGKHIVMSTASDGDKCMLEFAKYLDTLAQTPDIIITTIREDDNNEDQMGRMLALLEAIGNGTQNLDAYYTSNIMTKPIHTPFAPSALIHHAFVLHLEGQNVNGAANKTQALKPYWDDNADKLKHMIDFALARL